MGLGLVFTLVVVAICVLVVALMYITRNGRTAPFRDPGTKEVIPGSIAEVAIVPLNGLRQRVVIRGRNSSSRILIWLHGGPGLDETMLYRKFNSEFEDQFTVVYWMQRGACGSFIHAWWRSMWDKRNYMAVDTFVADLHDLITYLHGRGLGSSVEDGKVVLVGHSWGTAIGTLYAQRHPERVAAYVGVAQVTSMPRIEEESYNYILQEASKPKSEGGNPCAKTLIERSGPPPYTNFTQVLTQRFWLSRFGGSVRRRLNVCQWIDVFYRCTEYSSVDMLVVLLSLAWSYSGPMGKEFAKLDVTVYKSFAMPVAFLLGQYDRQISVHLAQEWFDAITVPGGLKQLHVFEHSAHWPHMEEWAAFNATLRSTLKALLPPTKPEAVITPKDATMIDIPLDAPTTEHKAWN